LTKTEFVKVMLYISSGIQKPISDATLEVYWDLLGDLPLEALQTAARRVMLAHPWSMFLSIAELREAAITTLRGNIRELTAGEAWAVAWKVVSNTDPEVEGSFDRACQRYKASRIVVDTILRMGLVALCGSSSPVDVIRGQFTRAFDGIAAAEKAAALLPEKVKSSVREIGSSHDNLVRQLVPAIGEKP
jgi:hypothetical protein